jgi:hypothetical protein
MPARKLSIGDAVIAQAALTKIVAESTPAPAASSLEPAAMAESILALAADVQYKPVSGALTITFDLSGPELVPAKHAGNGD